MGKIVEDLWQMILFSTTKTESCQVSHQIAPDRIHSMDRNVRAAYLQSHLLLKISLDKLIYSALLKFAHCVVSHRVLMKTELRLI